ncbi:signaling threshold-regulating transmembrane adapter 1 [Anabas testudineus]|uniref:signaling threshold-regulating transmembrane adapter 1 n=1 Tax=Anabas testudineus TaxID=64144 RepID=UPI000E457F32|nr:signaling threshold-regulating transmembrane adapter 1 [Anabas testudineus]
MANCCNGTGGWNFLCPPLSPAALFWIISAMLILSLTCNIFCCVSKYCSGKGRCPPRMRRSQGSRQMEENPIYGNISYMQTSLTLLTEADPQHLPRSSSSLREQHRVSSSSQSKTQDCYANLTLKPPRPQSGRSSPQIQYSDVVQLEEPSVSEKVDEGNTDAVSTMSDLYASVQTQRTKTVDTADNGEDYANHL